MTNEKLNKKSRNIFKSSNKYQDQIIFLVYFPTVFTFLAFILIVFIGNPFMAHAMLHATSSHIGNLLSQFSSLIVLVICLFFFLSLVAAFIISNSLVGAFERIIRELDEIIAGGPRKFIVSRPKDTLSADLLKRINVLVKFYVENKATKSGD